MIEQGASELSDDSAETGVEAVGPKTQEVIYDLGCGSYKYPSSIGIDLSAESQADIVANIEHLEGVVSDEVADKVVLIHTLEHVNPLAVLKQAHRILKQGGIVYVEVPNAYSASIVLRLLLRNTYSVVPDHIQTFGFVELTNVLGMAGFRVMRWGFKDAEERFLSLGELGWSNKLGRLLGKILPQFSEVLWMEGVKASKEN